MKFVLCLEHRIGDLEQVEIDKLISSRDSSRECMVHPSSDEITSLKCSYSCPRTRGEAESVGNEMNDGQTGK